MLSGIQQNTLMDNDPLAHGYYVADLLVALAVVVLMLRARRTRPELARMLLLGTLIGLVWELQVFGLSAWTNTPIIEWARRSRSPPWCSCSPTPCGMVPS